MKFDAQTQVEYWTEFSFICRFIFDFDIKNILDPDHGTDIEVDLFIFVLISFSLSYGHVGANYVELMMTES